LRGLEWPDYAGESLTVCRSIWKTFSNGPKTRASAKAVPVIRHLAEILNAFRISMGNPATGVMFHSGDGNPMDAIGQSAPKVHQINLGSSAKLLKPNAGEVAERLKAAVC
jgi:hypothetical protein